MVCSIVVQEPTSTSSSIITLPICGIFLNVPSALGKPNPSAPIIAPECTTLLLPISVSEFGYAKIVSLMTTLLIKQFG
jgi:hypothetical protein